jgi:hypothetical protein
MELAGIMAQPQQHALFAGYAEAYPSFARSRQMPSLTEHQSSQFTKLLLIGDSGTGKTGSLASLALEGYKLRILDFDNGLDPLKKQIQRADPAKLANVEFITLRDKVKASPAGPILDGGAKAFVASLKLLDNWSEFGKPAEFGPDVILVLDSMTFWANAAYDWADSMNPGAKDKRNIYYAAQQAIESSLGLLSSESFRTNVIVISHVRWVDRPDGTTKGYPSAIGGALSPQIPAYFNSVALATSSGTGDKVKRTIQTAPTALIDLKNPAPFAMQASLPIETGLATFFKTVRS